MANNKRSARFPLARKFGCFLVPLLLSATAYAQPAPAERFSLLLEGSTHSTAEKNTIRQRVLGQLRSRGNERMELTALSGPLVTSAACPVGYVRRANYDFSIQEIEIVKDQGIDCEGPNQCHAWQVELDPEDDQQLYDFSIQLQCSADDTLPSRSHAGGDSAIVPAGASRPRG